MKRLLFILFLFPSVLFAQTTWYIHPDGHDDTGDGTAGNPWKTLYKATATVPAIQGEAGDIIHVNAGSYTEVQQCALAVDISIEGDGAGNTIIHSTYAGGNSATVHYNSAIYLANGTNTAQHISNITLDGNNLTANNGIGVTGRSHVSIYNCIIQNINYVGVELHGVGTHDNAIYNNSIINCGGCIPAGDPNGHHPNILLSNQTNPHIYNNIITQTARAAMSNGEGISGYEPLKGAHIYNNIITCQLRNGTTWSFALEFFKVSGTEINNNVIIGECNMGQDVLLSGYAYGLYFHHNTVGPSAPNGTTYNYGLQCEHTYEGVIVDANLFKNLYAAVLFEQYNSAAYYGDDVTITNNKIYNCGNTGGGGFGVYFHTGDPTLPQYITDVKIWNNTIIASPTYGAQAGIMLPSGNVLTNFSLRNNIIQGFSIAPIYENQTQYGSMATLSVENNLFYQCGHSNTPYYVDWAPDPATYTYQNNVIGSDPLFINPSLYNYHIPATSPAYHTGINVGLATDYDGVNFNNPPSIGCFEYTGVSLTVPIVTTTAIDDITETTASSGGNVTSDGGAAVTDRGVCWSTGSMPTTADSHTSDGSGTGIFASSITGLTGGLTYYVRAYAINSVGTAYGSVRAFIAGNPATGGSGIIKGSGRLYKILNRPIKTE